MKSITQKTTSYAGTILIAVLITAIFTAVYVSAQAASITVTQNSFRSDYSYLIYEEDGVYYAKNGTTGEVSWTSTNFGTTIQNTINAINEGTIVVKNSTTVYSLSAAITPKDKVDIILEGGATLQASQNLSPAMFNFEKSASTSFFTRISGGVLSGGNVCSFAFSFLNASGNIFIENMEIQSFASTPLRLNGVGGLKVRNVKITAPSGAFCIGLDRHATSITGNHFNTFENVAMYSAGSGNQIGVKIDGDATGNSFTRCFFSGVGMYIVGDGTYTPALNVIDSCWFERGTQGTSNEYGLKISDVGSHVTKPKQTIIKNTHIGKYDYGILCEYSDNTVIRDLYGVSQNTCDIYLATGSENTYIENGVSYSSANYVLTNSPTNVITKGLGWERTITAITNTTATTFVFNHECVSTVDSVIASFDAVTAAEIKGYSWTSTTTQVTVTVYAEDGKTLPATMTILSVTVNHIP